jgi:group I intron endonuclease
MSLVRPAFLYAIVNRTTGHLYVGKTVHLVKRWHDHRKMAGRGAKTHFYKAVRKYGAENFYIFALEEQSTEEAALEAEVWWIAYFRSIGVVLYNENGGGRGGKNLSPEARQRRSEAVRAGKALKPMSAEGRKKIAEANTRRILSEDTRRKLADGTRRTAGARRAGVSAATTRRWQEYREAKKCVSG